jgi:hypothetical protein
MTPNADRDKETSIPINQATFLMSNMVAQAPGNNQGPWAAFEAFLRTFVDTGNELYIVAGPAGTGGFNGTLDANKNPIETDTLANGHVTVPAATWKIALVLPKNSGDDVSRVSCTTRTISVIMPNDDAIRPDDWHTYIASINEVEALSGYDLLSNVPKPYQACIQVAKDGKVPNDPLTPGTQTITFTQPSGKTYGDAPFTAEATGGESGNPVTFAAAGACSSSGTDGATITITGAGTCTITASQAGFTAANGEIVYPPADLVTRMVPVGRAAPSLSALSSPSIGLGTAATTLSGHIANGILVPTGTVAITLNGVTQAAAIQANGDFSSTFATGSLAVINGGYGITYVYAGDANFTGVSGTGTLTIGYSVALLFDNTRAAKAGSTLPIKLVLTDTAGRDVSSPSVTVTAARLEQVSIAATSQVQDSGNANPDGNFRFDASLGAAGGYIFNLTTKGLATGTYSLVFTIAGDAGPHAVSFQVR